MFYPAFSFSVLPSKARPLTQLLCGSPATAVQVPSFTASLLLPQGNVLRELAPSESLWVGGGRGNAPRLGGSPTQGPGFVPFLRAANSGEAYERECARKGDWGFSPHGRCHFST